MGILEWRKGAELTILAVGQMDLQQESGWRQNPEYGEKYPHKSGELAEMMEGNEYGQLHPVFERSWRDKTQAERKRGMRNSTGERGSREKGR